jgi:hypothetical protein
MGQIAKLVKPLICYLCKKPAPEGTSFDIGINDLTPDDVSKLKLNMPEVPPSPADKPCPCGPHGKLYGECCKGKGRHALGNSMLLGSTPIIVPGARTHILSSTVMGDTRFRVLWNKLFHSPLKETFHEFLDGLVLTHWVKTGLTSSLLVPSKSKMRSCVGVLRCFASSKSRGMPMTL